MFKFNFKHRQVNYQKQIEKQNKYFDQTVVKKDLNTNNFVYSSKRVSFSVKCRNEYWNNIQKQFQLNSDIINHYILQRICKNGENDVYEKFINQPISPILALTLILINDGLFNTNTFNEYLNNDKHQVYAYTHWNGNSFINNSDKLYIEDPFNEETETYKQILPGYNKINVMNFFKGYYLYQTTSGFVFSDNKYFGSYNIDLKRFQRIYANNTDISSTTISDYNNLDNNILLNKYPELDSYLYADGLFKKITDSDYNSQSYISSILRGGYGYGPINIACFLKCMEFDSERLVDIILGLLMSNDSGMTMGDAIKGLNEWRSANLQNDILDLNLFSNITILKYLEYIGSIFLTILLGLQVKNKIKFNPLFDFDDQKIFSFGNLMSESFDILSKILKTDKIIQMKEIEIFSFDIPCIYKNNTETKGTFNMFGYSKNFSDIVVDDSPLESMVNIKKLIEKERKLTDYIIPNDGYNIYDFVSIGLNKCLITQIIKNIQEFTDNRKIFVSQSNNFYYEMEERDITYISPFLSTDLLIAPRKERIFTQKPVNNINQLYASTTNLDMEIDNTKCRVNFSVADNTWNSLAQLSEVNYSLPEQSLVIVPRDDSVYITVNGNKTHDHSNLHLLVLRYDDFTKKNIRIEKGYILYVNKIKYTIIEDVILDDLFKILITYAHNDTGDNTRCGYVIGLNTTPKNTNIEVVVIKKNFDNLYYPDTEYLTTVNIKNIKAIDEFGNYSLLGISGLELLSTEKKLILENTGQKLTTIEIVTNISILHYNNEYYSLPYLNSRILTDRQNTLFKSSYLRSINVQDRILQIFQECGFNINIESKITKIWNEYKTIDERKPIFNFLDRFALCILKLCFVNSFFTSYSLDFLGKTESCKEFYNIIGEYFSDFINIKQNYNRNIKSNSIY